MAIFWRVEWHDENVIHKPFLSTGWGGIDGNPPTTKTGLSACYTAQELLSYFEPWRETVERFWILEPEDDHPHHAAYMEEAAFIDARRHRCPNEDSRVIVMCGEKIGSGVDGDCLVRPTGEITELTYGELRECVDLKWLDGVEDSEEIRRILLAKPTSPKGRKFRVGAALVRMSAAAARRWNDAEFTERDERAASVYDPSNDLWISMDVAVLIKSFVDGIDGEEAVEI